MIDRNDMPLLMASIKFSAASKKAVVDKPKTVVQRRELRWKPLAAL